VAQEKSQIRRAGRKDVRREQQGRHEPPRFRERPNAPGHGQKRGSLPIRTQGATSKGDGPTKILIEHRTRGVVRERKNATTRYRRARARQMDARTTARASSITSRPRARICFFLKQAAPRLPGKKKKKKKKKKNEQGPRRARKPVLPENTTAVRNSIRSCFCSTSKAAELHNWKKHIGRDCFCRGPAGRRPG